MNDTILERLVARLQGASPSEWVACLRDLRQSGDFPLAECLVEDALRRFPGNRDLLWIKALLAMDVSAYASARATLLEIARDSLSDVGIILRLARMLVQCGSYDGAASAITGMLATAKQSVEVVLKSVDLLCDADRKSIASKICEGALAEGVIDARLSVVAGSLASQLGNFQRAREHFLQAVELDNGNLSWAAVAGLVHTQRYVSASNPDFSLLHKALLNKDLPDRSRASILFALGKAYDDVGDSLTGAWAFREANALARGSRTWTRFDWWQLIQSRLASGPLVCQSQRETPWKPVFIVGIPRSGSSVIADRLCRFAGTRNRGELPWLHHLARQLAEPIHGDTRRLLELARIYEMHLLQDDGRVQFYIDKQPLNLLFIDLIVGVWRQAKIIYCERSPRDTALSIWMQDFSDAQHSYSFDFGDIAQFMAGCRQLMMHWESLYPMSIRKVCYEDFLDNPEETLQELANWIGLEEHMRRVDSIDAPVAIATASLWQARQSVYKYARERWRRYISYLPELAEFE